MFEDISTADILWAAAVLLLAVAAFSGWAEHRRSRRRNLDRPGWVPWNFIQVIAFMVAVVSVALAIKV